MTKTIEQQANEFIDTLHWPTCADVDVREIAFESFIAGAKSAGWQPIETAPRDGVLILGFWSEYRASDTGVLLNKLGCNGARREIFSGNHEIYNELPDLWMPLPPKPEE